MSPTNEVQKALRKSEDPRPIEQFLRVIAQGYDPYTGAAARLLLNSIAGDIQSKPEPSKVHSQLFTP